MEGSVRAEAVKGASERNHSGKYYTRQHAKEDRAGSWWLNSSWQGQRQKSLHLCVDQVAGRDPGSRSCVHWVAWESHVWSSAKPGRVLGDA